LLQRFARNVCGKRTYALRDEMFKFAHFWLLS
jgi:hypothetical protein